jgi:hypothetical protein
MAFDPNGHTINVVKSDTGWQITIVPPPVPPQTRFQRHWNQWKARFATIPQALATLTGIFAAVVTFIGGYQGYITYVKNDPTALVVEVSYAGRRLAPPETSTNIKYSWEQNLTVGDLREKLRGLEEKQKTLEAVSNSCDTVDDALSKNSFVNATSFAAYIELLRAPTVNKCLSHFKAYMLDVDPWC